MATLLDDAPNEYYRLEGDGFLPTRLSGSPWRRDAQNGVALGLLASHVLEAQLTPERDQLARFTLDILRPAPFALTRVSWRAEREGPRGRLLEGILEAGGVAAVRVSVLIVSADGATAPIAPEPLLPPDEATERELTQRSGLDVRLVKRDSQPEHIRETTWVQVRADVATGYRASAIGAAIAAADTGAVSLGRYRAAWDFPNLDVVTHFSRPPVDGWLRVDSEPMMLGAGICIINHRITDGAGPVARAHQVLFFTAKPGAAG